MADERERRMLGAGDSITVEEKSYTLRPVVAQHLADLEQAALSAFKRNYLLTYRDNIDLLDGDTSQLMTKKLDEVALWDLKDLPFKTAYSVTNVPITDELKAWVLEWAGEVPDSDNGIKAVVNMALDSEKITSEQVKEMTGKYPVHGQVRYDQWWVTASINGMIQMIHSAVRKDHSEVTTKDVSNWPFPKIVEAARIAESLSTAAMGNG